jgi:SAM-dependent methyltransferase
VWQENAAFARSIPEGATLLDAGAGRSPYRPLFAHTRYESADFEQVDKEYADSTYVCDLRRIPVEDHRFDAIVFNQVMEHVPEPKEVLLELNRVLKPGGRMICSAPLFYQEHEQPYDFFRYTQFGLRHLFAETGFEVERLDWLEGYFGTVGYQCKCMAKYLPLHPRDLGGGLVGIAFIPVVAGLKLVFFSCSVLFHQLEVRTKYTRGGHPKNYVAVVRKSAPASAPDR